MERRRPRRASFGRLTCSWVCGGSIGNSNPFDWAPSEVPWVVMQRGGRSVYSAEPFGALHWHVARIHSLLVGRRISIVCGLSKINSDSVESASVL
jgi:hypothetical protein